VILSIFVKKDKDGKWYGPGPGFIPKPPPKPETTLEDLKKDIDLIKVKLGI
jgi:hypothetical protein